MSTGNVDSFDTESNEPSDPYTTVVTKKPRKVKKILNPNHASASQPPTSQLDSDDLNSDYMDDVINSVAHISDPTLSFNEQYHTQVNVLKQIISGQNVIINSVVSRLNFLLSIFNIDEVSMPPMPIDAEISDHKVIQTFEF